jgi:hypothetical protein
MSLHAFAAVATLDSLCRRWPLHLRLLNGRLSREVSQPSNQQRALNGILYTFETQQHVLRDRYVECIPLLEKDQLFQNCR